VFVDVRWRKESHQGLVHPCKLSKGLRKRLEQYVDFRQNEGEGENLELGLDPIGVATGMDGQQLQDNAKESYTDLFSQYSNFYCHPRAARANYQGLSSSEGSSAERH
jgi:hypothetical protein